MRLTVLSLFPEIIQAVVAGSITGRALSNGLFELETIQIRDFAVNRYGKVDDYCFGGGTGMLMMAEPVWQAWQKACEHAAASRRTIYLSPRGQVFNQQKAAELAQVEHLIFLCGHYEGVDQRVIDEIVDEEISLGDYVITGGELAACVVIDALLRLVPGVLPNEQAYRRESHMDGTLEYPQYTRPATWHGRQVPEVLLSGHQARIDEWQKLESLRQTMLRRPDLFNKLQLDARTWDALLQFCLDSVQSADDRAVESDEQN